MKVSLFERNPVDCIRTQAKRIDARVGHRGESSINQDPLSLLATFCAQAESPSDKSLFQSVLKGFFFLFRVGSLMTPTKYFPVSLQYVNLVFIIIHISGQHTVKDKR